MKKIKLKNKVIGGNEPIFIIAEAGVNHNGDITIAHELLNELQMLVLMQLNFKLLLLMKSLLLELH